LQKGEKSPELRRLTDLCLEAVQQSKNSGKRKTNRALNPKRSDFLWSKSIAGQPLWIKNIFRG
jgi:hypothetical protein